MNTFHRLVAAMMMAALFPPLLLADTFDRLNSADLDKAAEGAALETLTMQQAARTKPLPGADSTCLVIKTDQGNWSKVLVSWQFRKTADKPVPVLVLERYVTFSNDGRDVAVASGKTVMLFGGFAFDFDIGQVVPEALGGDVQFQSSGEFRPIRGASLHVLDGAPFAAAKPGAKPDPNDHEGVLPRDFSGTWTVNADGRWTGTWTITVDESGACTGEFLSDETKSLYALSGKFVPGQPSRIRLSVDLANALQSFDAYLWTKDKSAMAGTVTLAGKTFGFYAVRKTER